MLPVGTLSRRFDILNSRLSQGVLAQPVYKSSGFVPDTFSLRFGRLITEANPAKTDEGLLDDLAWYKKVALNHQFLDKDDELRLHKRMQGRKLKNRIAARNELIQSVAQLVVNIAKRYRNKGLPFMDLVQEGNLGAIRAAEDFDPSYQTKFATHAFYWIRRSIQTAVLKEKSQTIFAPGTQFEALIKLQVARDKFRAESPGHRMPTVEELAELIKSKQAYIQELLDLERRLVHPSLDREADAASSEGESLMSLLQNRRAATPEAVLAKAEFPAKLDRALRESKLNPRDQALVWDWLEPGLDGKPAYTQKQLCRKYGISHQALTQARQRIFAKLAEGPHGRDLAAYLGFNIAPHETVPRATKRPSSPPRLHKFPPQVKRLYQMGKTGLTCLKKLVVQLPDQMEQQVLTLRLGLGKDGTIYSLDETAKKMVEPKETVSKIQNTALTHLEQLARKVQSPRRASA